jgi:hypothetical protein
MLAPLGLSLSLLGLPFGFLFFSHKFLLSLFFGLTSLPSDEIGSGLVNSCRNAFKRFTGILELLRGILLRLALASALSVFHSAISRHVFALHRGSGWPHVRCRLPVNSLCL